MNFHSRYTGFTLAEVLITLVIIGVIAAISIPTIVQGTQKQEYATALKKAHSVLCQSLVRIGQNNGYPGGDYDFFNNLNFMDEFAQVTNVVQKCENQQACFGSKLKGASSEYKMLNKTASPQWDDGKSVITADGMLYTFVKASSASSIYGLSDEDVQNVLGRIIVDVNGSRKPNVFGLDSFVFYVVDYKGIVPAGSYSTSDCNRSGRGGTCAARVLREGKISY